MNRPHAHSREVIQLVKDHIGSFEGRKSHYSLASSKRLYLPDELNITKMYGFYCQKYPDNLVSYETYRRVFNEHFNISFGYPRQDTCSTCDEIEARIAHCNTAINCPDTPTDVKSSTMRKKAETVVEKNLHLRKASVFYTRKSAARKSAQGKDNFEAIAFDFQKKSSLYKHIYQCLLQTSVIFLLIQYSRFVQ